MRGIFSITVLLITFAATAQSPKLIRFDTDSLRIVNNNNCSFIANAHVNRNGGDPIRVHDLIPAETDVIFFETASGAPLQVVFEIKKGATKVQLYDIKDVWLTNLYEGSFRKADTRDFLTGKLDLKRNDNQEIVINGKLNIDSEYPNTHQEIIFNKSKLKISTLPEILAEKDQREALERRQDEWFMECASIMAREREDFWDSVFNLKKFPGNIISGSEVSQGAVFLDAELTGKSEYKIFEIDDLTGVVSERTLEIVPGKKKVIFLRILNNDKRYTLGIETGNDGKTILFDGISTSTATVRSINDKENFQSINGILDLEFGEKKFTGNFEVPKLRLEDIKNLEERIRKKQKEYLSKQR